MRGWVVAITVSVLGLSSGCAECDSPRGHDAAAGASASDSTIIADDRPGPRSVAVDDANVYWVEAYTGDVMRAPRAGGEATRLATTGHTPTTALAVGGGFVYWSDPGEGAVLQIATSGEGAPERVIARAVPALAADATHVYALGTELARVRHDRASEPAWPASHVDGTTLAIGPTHACAVGAEGLLRCAALDDGRVAVLARGVSGGHAIVVTRTHAFVCDGPMRALLRIALEGGAPEALGTPCGIGSALAADGDGVMVVGIQGDLRRIDPARRRDVMLAVASLGHMNRSHIDAVVDRAELFAAVDSSSVSWRAGVIDLTNPSAPVPEVRFEGVIQRVAAGGVRESELPMATSTHVAWIDDESAEALDRAVRFIETVGGPAQDAMREGILALRLVAHDRALAGRAAERLRLVLAPSVRVIVDTAIEPRTVAGQVEVVFSLDDVARAYAPSSPAR